MAWIDRVGRHRYSEQLRDELAKADPGGAAVLGPSSNEARDRAFGVRGSSIDTPRGTPHLKRDDEPDLNAMGMGIRKTEPSPQSRPERELEALTDVVADFFAAQYPNLLPAGGMFEVLKDYRSHVRTAAGQLISLKALLEARMKEPDREHRLYEPTRAAAKADMDEQARRLHQRVFAKSDERSKPLVPRY